MLAITPRPVTISTMMALKLARSKPTLTMFSTAIARSWFRVAASRALRVARSSPGLKGLSRSRSARRALPGMTRATGPGMMLSALPGPSHVWRPRSRHRPHEREDARIEERPGEESPRTGRRVGPAPDRRRAGGVRQAGPAPARGARSARRAGRASRLVTIRSVARRSDPKRAGRRDTHPAAGGRTGRPARAGRSAGGTSTPGADVGARAAPGQRAGPGGRHRLAAAPG